MKLRREVLAAALLLAIALPVAGCGGSDEPSTGTPQNPAKFTLELDFYVNPDHAGIYTALDRGYFRQAGLDVRPQVPSDPSAPIKEVAAGRADLAVSYEPEVFLARAGGLPVKAVGAIVGSPLTSLISLPKAGIDGAAGLRGKTVGTAGIPYQTDFLQTIAQFGGFSASSLKEVNLGLGLLPALLGGKVDAILGGFRNIEGVDLRLRGLDPQIVPVDQLGVPTYDELVLVARDSTVSEHPDAIRAFLSALARGTSYAAEHPQVATNAVLSAGSGLDPLQTRAEVDATLPLLSGASGRFGQMNRREWAAFAAWMTEQGLISSPSPMGEVLTNSLLPR